MIENIRKLEYIMIRLGILALVVASSLGACSKLNQYFNMKDDNVVEEILEDMIEDAVGVDIDLTPSAHE